MLTFNILIDCFYSSACVFVIMCQVQSPDNWKIPKTVFSLFKMIAKTEGKGQASNLFKENNSAYFASNQKW